MTFLRMEFRAHQVGRQIELPLIPCKIVLARGLRLRFRVVTATTAGDGAQQDKADQDRQSTDAG
ncbi:hypothetical protein B6K69_10695 [Fuscovulum blasticum]|nr:hypothetical protein B6K69_10695 [Fuscovulum blasticum]